MTVYEILERKRFGQALAPEEIQEVVRGASDGSWNDAQLGAFLMAAAIHPLDAAETRALALAMLESGERWQLRDRFPLLVDKHSTGGVGDKVSLILGPLLSACGIRVVMLTGRSLGHTGGTADKLETIPGLDLAFDRQTCERLLDEVGLAIGVATAAVAPADRRMYALRDQTATVSSLPLVVGSILSKKLAVGPAAVVFDVKTGNGAIFPDREEAARLAQLMVEICRSLGCAASALVTDMSQPLGNWCGHAAEVLETYECLDGKGDPRLVELVLDLCESVTAVVGSPVTRERLRTALEGGEARARFEDWAAAQGAESGWLRKPRFELAPAEAVIAAERTGVLAGVDTRRLGLLLQTAAHAHHGLDVGVSLRYSARLGQPVERGEELARVYLRAENDELVRDFAGCFVVDDAGEAPPLVYQRI